MSLYPYRVELWRLVGDDWEQHAPSLSRAAAHWEVYTHLRQWDMRVVGYAILITLGMLKESSSTARTTDCEHASSFLHTKVRC